MGPSPLHRGREARASPQSPEAQGLWKVLPWDLGRDSGRMVFTGRAAGLGGAAAPTSCQNKDQDSECWVCPLWAAWYTPPSPNQGKATMRVRCAQAMVLQQPSWMCLPSRRPHLPPSLHAECPAWTDFTAGLPSALGPGWAGCRLIQTPALVLVRGTPASFRWRRETQGSPWTRHWTARWGLFLSASPHCPTSNHLLAFFKRGQGVSEHRPAGLEAKEAPWQLWVPLPRDSPTAAPAHVRTQVV